MDNENKEFLFMLFIGFFLGVTIFALIMAIIDPIMLKQETIDDICKELTGTESAVAEEVHRKLVCLIPSFDETQNIIIKTNDK